MNPLVDAAWIALGGTLTGIFSATAIAIVSNRNTRKMAEKTLDAARADRLWDAQSAAYADAIRLIQHRRLTRDQTTRTVRYDAETEKHIEQWLADIKLPEWAETQARLVAFASPDVLEATRASGQANDAAVTALEHYKFLAGEAQKASAAGSAAGPEGNIVLAARNDALAAATAANDRDDELLDAIRADLHDRPSVPQTQARPRPARAAR